VKAAEGKVNAVDTLSHRDAEMGNCGRWQQKHVVLLTAEHQKTGPVQGCAKIWDEK